VAYDAVVADVRFFDVRRENTMEMTPQKSNPMVANERIRTLMKCGFALLLGALIFAGTVPAAQAQTTLPTRVNLLPVKNTKEINLSGLLSLDAGNAYSLAGAYGIFLSPPVEVGLTGSIAGAKNVSTVSTLGAFADYYFTNTGGYSTNPLLPYVGIFAGYAHQYGSNTSVGAQAGVKYFFNPDVAGTLEYDYRSTQHSSGTNTILLGFSTFFH
jgi:hypothetical protein